MGPPLGGFITTYFDWRLIFFINVPIGVLGVILATRFIENVREEDVPPLDLHGLVLSASASPGVVFGFAVTGQHLVPYWMSGAVTWWASLPWCSTCASSAHAARGHRPQLLRIPTFRAAVVGGSLFRIGVGAIPFALPLMLQLTFGLSPFASGLLTFTSSAGALVMKTTAKPILRRFGFWRVLVFNSLPVLGLHRRQCAVHAADAASGHYRCRVLLMGGFFRSLEFTAINAIAYADVSQPEMSRATSFVSVAQQVAISLGVALAGLVLEAMRSIRGETELQLADFTPASCGGGGERALRVQLPAPASQCRSGSLRPSGEGEHPPRSARRGASGLLSPFSPRRRPPGLVACPRKPVATRYSSAESARLGRLDVPDRRKIPLQVRQQRAFGAALNDLGEEAARAPGPGVRTPPPVPPKRRS